MAPERWRRIQEKLSDPPNAERNYIPPLERDSARNSIDNWTTRNLIGVAMGRPRFPSGLTEHANLDKRLAEEY